MRDVLVEALTARFAAYGELVESVDDGAFAARPDVPRHKTLAEHLWCVVGARESYARAIEAGAWSGFACSLAGTSRDDFAAALASSSDAARAAIAGVVAWTPEHEKLLVALFEHEVMHEGQLIRHLYAIERSVPASFPWA